MLDNPQLFICVRCDHVDMVDLAHSRLLALQIDQQRQIELGTETELTPYKPFVCTYCLTGLWHNHFPYKLYDPANDEVCNPPMPLA